MDVEHDVVEHLILREPVQLIADEPHHSMSTEVWSDGRRPPGNMVIHLSLIRQHVGSLAVMVEDGGFSQLSRLLVIDPLFFVTGRNERLLNDLLQNPVGVLVNIRLITHDIPPLMLLICITLKSLLSILKGLVLPVVANTSHKTRG